jgi:hypothetical protein
VAGDLVDERHRGRADAEDGRAAGGDLRAPAVSEKKESKLLRQRLWWRASAGGSRNARVLDRACADAERLGRRLEDQELLLRVSLDRDLGLAANENGRWKNPRSELSCRRGGAGRILHLPCALPVADELRAATRWTRGSAGQPRGGGPRA